MVKTRTARIERKTKETQITLELCLDGTGASKIKTPVNFLNHMLENFAKHARFDLTINAKGDVKVEDHHLVEDVGLCLGEALDKALGDKKGIERMGYAIVPMYESLATAAVDLSGRPYSVIDITYSEFKDARLGDMTKENVPHFFASFANKGKFNLNLRVEGANDHHKVEACFKALAKALYDATRVTRTGIPSTKGLI
jgi:imidazoleglycerol-phosphate dehydratase